MAVAMSSSCASDGWRYNLYSCVQLPSSSIGSVEAVLGGGLMSDCTENRIPHEHNLLPTEVSQDLHP
jgi:hypothetical protein